MKPKHFLALLVIQVCLAFTLMFGLSNTYDTPKEKKLKGDIAYLINEFDVINQKNIENNALLNKVLEKDSLIYKSIFEIDDKNLKELDTYYESLVENDYTELIDYTSEKLSKLRDKLSKEIYQLGIILEEAKLHDDMVVHIPAIQPIENKKLKRVASGWGYRIHPIYKIKKFHYGLDFTARVGTPIYATGDGTIIEVIDENSKWSKGYGNLVIINHGYGYKTLYAHMSKFNVKRGQKVKRGEIIGYVGNTGLSTGPHLHYEVLKNGRKVNPIHYLFNDLTPEEYQKIIELSSSIKKSYD